MHYQHRGQQSRPKNDIHTVWEHRTDLAFDMPTWAWLLVPAFLVGLWVWSL